MSGNTFYQLNPLLICLVLIVILVAVLEMGFLAGKGRGESVSDKSDIPLILGGVLTLLALLLGFTYSMSEARFETRRQLVVEEANAIGTTYLRAKTLADPQNSEIQALLRQYAALRVHISQDMGENPRTIAAVDRQTKRLQDMIWSRGAVLARENPDPVITLFLNSLNEMIDLHASRLAAFRNRVPLPIYIVLFATSAIVLWLLGYYFGSLSRRMLTLSLPLVFLVACVMWLIMDLDQPTRGAIKASQQSLIDLDRDLNQVSQKALTRSQ
ncbi:MAG: hypothetical protein WCL39_11800 [Armatimonadota bacterium]